MQLEQSVTLFDDNKVESKFAELRVTADGITSEVSRKVGNDEVISRINQSAESVTIDAGKVNIQGVINAINSDGTTTIDGGKITTNSISANKIKIAELVNIGPTSGAHAKVTSNGLDVYGGDGSTIVSSFGATARIGSNNSANVYIDNTSINIRNGTSTILSKFTSDGAELGANSETATISIAKGNGILKGQSSSEEGKGIYLYSSNSSASSSTADRRSARVSSRIVNSSTNKEAFAMYDATTYPASTNGAAATIRASNYYPTNYVDFEVTPTGIRLEDYASGTYTNAFAVSNAGVLSLKDVQNTFTQTSHALFSSTSIAAGGLKSDTLTISKTGYVPIAISGIHASTRYFCPTGCYLSSRANGSGVISYMVYNPSGSAVSGNVTAYVIWMKVA